jgi:glyoxylase-like metal-dependent hydrolase (beta-lactamase superfamily II)
MTIEQVELAQLFDSNIYLISSDRTVLIDAGIGFQADDTIASIKKMLNGRKLDILILTHRHYDHVGGAGAIIKEFSPKVYVGKDDAKPLREGDRASTLGTQFGGSLEPMDVNDLNDGDVIDIGEYKLRVIATPGHTIGSISLFDEVTGALFTGDTVFVGGVGKWTYPTANKKQLINSLKKLSGLKINGFYPGHGPYIPEGGNEHIINALRMMGVIT